VSLDNALRSSLVREGEAITIDVAAALPAIQGRVRAHRRRRALQGAVVALVAALVVWAPPGLRTESMDDRPRPAREPFPQEKLLDRPGEHADGRVVRVETGGTRAGGPRTPMFEPGSHERTGAAGTLTGSDHDGAGRRPPSTETTVGALSRRVIERYEVAYVSGTHVGENAGTSCSNGESAMGSNDCIYIQLDDAENEISFRIADDDGTVVGATVYQHAGGDGTELVSFCGSTNGYVAVEPGALLIVYLDTSDRCSEGRPHSGTFTAFLR
jgi:hypothetical protein